MKIFSQHDYDNFDLDSYGWVFCPTGDYTDIQVFQHKSDFHDNCVFRGNTTFMREARFGDNCTFGMPVFFVKSATFGSDCKFPIDSLFGGRTLFNGPVYFDGHRTKDSNPYISINRAGSVTRETRFFNFTDGIYVKSGRFFGSLAQFRARVKKDCKKNPKDNHKKLLQYLGMANIAAITFDGKVDFKGIV